MNKEKTIVVTTYGHEKIIDKKIPLLYSLKAKL